jgi:3-oxoacyl-[acyl-carrier-protein] synthase-3
MGGRSGGLRSRIVGTGSYVPEKIFTNKDFEKWVETTDQWILERTGIRERRIAQEKEACSDLALPAARKALEDAKIDPMDLDLILVATTTPDMLFPSTACLIQDRLGARKAVGFDLAAACSGFIFALSVGDQYIRSGTYQTVLVIGAEVMSKITNWKDRSTCVLFGDGAGAVVLKPTLEERGILSSHLHSDGSYWDLIYVPGGGSKEPPSENLLKEGSQYIRMKGNETFKLAVRTLEEVTREALRENGLTPEQISLFIPHQANFRILKATAERLGLPMEKVFFNGDRYGNTSAASIPIALDEAVRGGKVSPMDLIVFGAFGSGLTWGAILVRW